MNCKEYRESITADPAASFAGAAEHAAECAECEAYRCRILSLDDLIARALAIDVPEIRMPDLPESGRDSNVIPMPARRFTVPVWLGIAASVVVAATLAIRLLTNDVVFPSLAAEIVAHLDHEQESRIVTSDAVSDERLGQVIDGKAAMNAGAGLITYARSCVINGHTVPHLVIQGETGPVTVLLLPDEMIDAAIQLEGVGIRGVILPVGSGSIAIIGERDEPLEKMEKLRVDSMHWTT
jgi:hypothetical protein